MKKFTSSEKKVDCYEIEQKLVQYYIGQYDQQTREKGGKSVSLPDNLSLTLMNVRTYKEGQVEQIDSYIGAEGYVFLNVAHSEGLSERDVKFSYSSYMKIVDDIIGMMLEHFFENMQERSAKPVL